jgi:small subunit ribosomal protein S4
MGDPKKNRRKFSRPFKAWDRVRIEEEKELIKEFYFKNKSEIWKLTSKLRKFARQAKRLIALKTPQAEKEKLQLLTKLRTLGLISESGGFDEVLGITPKDMFGRRLQSIVFSKGLAKTMKQARQFITHGHIFVDGKKMTAPNYLVPKSKETLVAFSQNSALADSMHPERVQETKMPKKPEQKPEPKKAFHKTVKGKAR